MLEQMGDVVMKEYGEIVGLQSCWVMISLVFQNLKKYQRVAPSVLLRNDAFSLKTYLMKPFQQSGLTDEKHGCNYRHYRARRTFGNLLRIISNRWRVL